MLHQIGNASIKRGMSIKLDRSIKPPRLMGCGERPGSPFFIIADEDVGKDPSDGDVRYSRLVGCFSKRISLFFPKRIKDALRIN